MQRGAEAKLRAFREEMEDMRTAKYRPNDDVKEEIKRIIRRLVEDGEEGASKKARKKEIKKVIKEKLSGISLAPYETFIEESLQKVDLFIICM